MMARRRASVAGSFYPRDRDELASTVDALVAADPAAAPPTPPAPPALLVPHAGYACSGPVAGTAYRLVAGASVRTVVVAGPAHYVDPGGVVVPRADTWLTPLGEVAIDRERCDRLVEAGCAFRSDTPHDGEHAIEVQLPFLQRILTPGWSLVPLAVRGTSPDAVADALDLLAGDLVVVSSDLSHYLDEATARRRDRRTVDAILARDPAAIGDDDACGALAVRGLLTWARRRDLGVELLDLATSADTCAGPERVVGYAACALRAVG